MKRALTILISSILCLTMYGCNKKEELSLENKKEELLVENLEEINYKYEKYIFSECIQDFLTDVNSASNLTETVHTAIKHFGVPRYENGSEMRIGNDVLVGGYYRWFIDEEYVLEISNYLEEQVPYKPSIILYELETYNLGHFYILGIELLIGIADKLYAEKYDEFVNILGECQCDTANLSDDYSITSWKNNNVSLSVTEKDNQILNMVMYPATTNLFEEYEVNTIKFSQINERLDLSFGDFLKEFKTSDKNYWSIIISYDLNDFPSLNKFEESNTATIIMNTYISSDDISKYNIGEIFETEGEYKIKLIYKDKIFNKLEKI